MFGVVLFVTFIVPVIYPMYIAVMVVSYWCVYRSYWVATYAYTWISTGEGQIMETLDSIGIYIPILSSVSIICLDWLYWKNIRRIFLFYFVCLWCLVPVSMHYKLCLVTVCMKVMQNGRLLRFSKRTDCWCAFGWSISNQNSHFIGCIQSSSFQGYVDIHKSWEDIIC